MTRKMHGTWSSRWTFILAATGSAVGLGNIWKFPYIAGEHGGGAFVMIYLLCIVVIGVPIMMAETMLGRRGRQSPINTMRDLCIEARASRLWVAIGWSGVLAGLLILSFYSVIAGWSLNYIFTIADGTFINASSETVVANFETLQANKSEMIFWHTLFILMTMAVVIGGVSKGLGNTIRIIMPVLFVLLLALLGYGFTEGNFREGFSFLFNFKVESLTWGGVLVALGHAFFTLSLGMGAIMAYGSYMPGDTSIGKTVMTVAALDTTVALVAGLAIFPIVFAHESLQAGAGPGLLFVSLPVAFGNMTGGLVFGVLFFVLISLAAWSSAISLIEPGVAWLVETQKFGRVGANLLLGAVAWTLGLGTVLSFNDWAGEEYQLFGLTFFELVDSLTANFMLPLGGMFIAIFAGWFMRREHVRRELSHESPRMFELWRFLVRYISPTLVLLVFISLIWDMVAN
ncbi:sodium-dependent transporter [Gilvimarinus sp. F26214L]|uniref:sodium-dependent transporter n=1 Tax=Gilvimarinus sp. DZF01 TaxID=3461371 RepID=UPI00404687DA